jgi:hypothetical protein
VRFGKGDFQYVVAGKLVKNFLAELE